jgi:hypothetical protein
MTRAHFSGSYSSDDVQFLLKVIDVPALDITEKERRIQQQTAHYSEVISKEAPPSAQYMALYRTAMAENGPRMANDVLALAAHLNAVHAEWRPIVLVSLARAGTPVGVLLKRTLSSCFGREVFHYSVSIIRDRGIDENAMAYILARHADTSIAFIDGWTGKGVITEELSKNIGALNTKRGLNIDPALYVLSDLAGVAGYAPSFDDYLIPSSILNATVSGLVSRTILNAEYIGPYDFHGCLYYKQFEDIDLSRDFVDSVFGLISGMPVPAIVPSGAGKAVANEVNTAFIAAMLERTGLTNRNYVKPGVGEATRVLLRRVPDCLYVQDLAAPETRHLVALAHEKSVPVIVDADMPYKATAIIKIID